MGAFVVICIGLLLLGAMGLTASICSKERGY
jgi:hypothetical protein